MMESEFFEGFKAPVSTCFSDVLARCRFELGDTFHSHRDAYQKPWGEALKMLEWSFQVHFPHKMLGESNSHGSDVGVMGNWNTPLEGELILHKSNQKKSIKTFQGNLYDTLTIGSIDPLLELAPTPAPVACSEFTKDLGWLAIPIKHQCQFRMVFNAPYPIHMGKKLKLEEAFGKDSTCNLIPVTQFDIAKGKKVMPTCSICIFDLKMPKIEAEEKIKKALYVPVKNKKTNKSTFRVLDHGVLL